MNDADMSPSLQAIRLVDYAAEIQTKKQERANLFDGFALSLRIIAIELIVSLCR